MDTAVHRQVEALFNDRLEFTDAAGRIDIKVEALVKEFIERRLLTPDEFSFRRIQAHFHNAIYGQRPNSMYCGGFPAQIWDHMHDFVLETTQFHDREEAQLVLAHSVDCAFAGIINDWREKGKRFVSAGW